MTGTEIMGVVGFIVMLFGAIGGFWYRLNGSIDKNRADLAAHKLHVAETYVTKAGMSEQTAQIMKAIDGVGSKIDRTNDRLDTFMQPKTTRTRG
ncbi:hypothetical protein ACNSPG_15855 [Brucella pituitosa]|uniref:hypothetical protein n=1 Tax=Brucella pituitosa TaxID=571256 RepID=UPI003C71CDE8